MRSNKVRGPPVSEDDERFMRSALAIGRRGLGRTWPNPAVGCVIVRAEPERAPASSGAAGRSRAARPHAETQALRQAGRARRAAPRPMSRWSPAPISAAPALRRRAGAGRHGAGRRRAARPRPARVGPRLPHAGELRHRCHRGRLPRRGDRRPSRPFHPRSLRGRPAVTLKMALVVRPQGRRSGRPAGADHRPRGERARPSPARAERRRRGRHRHGAARTTRC